MLIVNGRKRSAHGPPHLWNVLILIVLLSIVVDEDTAHAKI
jgi:hypothetical protein